MTYTKHYTNLINRAKERTLEGYKESHHIIPKCLGGTDERDNLVDLTAREHFIAHLLLWKIHPESYGLIKAISMMCTGHKEHRSGNRMYGWLREKLASEFSRSQSGEGNSQFGTMWIHNLDLKESKKILKSDEIPEGWLKGRKLSWEVYYCKFCNTLLNNQRNFCDNLCSVNYRKKSNTYSNGMKGKTFSQTQLDKLKGHDRNNGEKNPSFGTMWIHNLDLKESKKIKKDEFPEYESLGWLKGRKMSFAG
jgi:hypothetical protein